MCRKCSSSKLLLYSGEQINSYTGSLPWLLFSSAARDQQHWSVPFLIQVRCLGCSSRLLIAINNTGLFRFLCRSTALIVLLGRCSRSTTLVCSVSYAGPLPWLSFSAASRDQQQWSVPFLMQVHCLGCSSRPLLAINNTGLFRFLCRSTALVVLLVRCSRSTTLVIRPASIRIWPGLEARPPHYQSRWPGLEARPPHYQSRWPGLEARPPHYQSRWPGIEARPPHYQLRWLGLETRPPHYQSRWPGIEARPPHYQLRWPGIEARPRHYQSRWPGIEARPPHYQSRWPGIEARPPHYQSRWPGIEARPPHYQLRWPGSRLDHRTINRDGRGSRLDHHTIN